MREKIQINLTSDKNKIFQNHNFCFYVILNFIFKFNIYTGVATSLFYAASGGHSDVVKVLLDHEADIKVNNHGELQSVYLYFCTLQ